MAVMCFRVRVRLTPPKLHYQCSSGSRKALCKSCQLISTHHSIGLNIPSRGRRAQKSTQAEPSEWMQPLFAKSGRRSSPRASSRASRAFRRLGGSLRGTLRRVKSTRPLSRGPSPRCGKDGSLALSQNWQLSMSRPVSATPSTWQKQFVNMRCIAVRPFACVRLCARL